MRCSLLPKILGFSRGRGSAAGIATGVPGVSQFFGFSRLSTKETCRDVRTSRVRRPDHELKHHQQQLHAWTFYMSRATSDIEPWPPNSPPHRFCGRNPSSAALKARWHDSSGPPPSEGWEETHRAGDLSSSESCDGWGKGHFSPGTGGVGNLGSVICSLDSSTVGLGRIVNGHLSIAERTAAAVAPYAAMSCANPIICFSQMFHLSH